MKLPIGTKMIKRDDLSTSKEREYFDYIMEHKANVKKAWEEVQGKLEGEFWLDQYLWHYIDDFVKQHDDSKLSNEEFDGYRQYFYPEPGVLKNPEMFRSAWLNHVHKNPHHWNHWVLVNSLEKSVALNMPFVYIFEMLLDWKAMSYKMGDTVKAFYEKNGKDMFLVEGTRVCLERWLILFEEAPDDNSPT